MESIRTSEELHALHRELWGWLATSGSKSKKRWPNFMLGVYEAKFECFACEENMIRWGIDGISLRCPLCPIKWGTERCTDEGSPFVVWRRMRKRSDRRRLARTIRDLPWSPRPECKP